MPWMAVVPAVAFHRASSDVFAELMSYEALSGNGQLIELAAIATATPLDLTAASSGAMCELCMCVPSTADAWLQCV